MTPGNLRRKHPFVNSTSRARIPNANNNPSRDLQVARSPITHTTSTSESNLNEQT
jgi:hypothetical protein